MGRGEYDGQSGRFSQPFQIAVFRTRASHKPLTRDETLRAAYNFLEHQVNSLTVNRLVNGQPVFDSIGTYDLRTTKLRQSRILHHLPKDASIKMNGEDIRAELYVGDRRYNPS